jgi:hypothetical protein
MNKTIPLGTARIFLETIGQVVYFPVWWYTRGFVSVLGFVGRSIYNQYESLGLGVWLKNLFVPMYGINDWAGRLISLLIRLFMIFFRGLFLIFFIILFFLLIIGYLLLLPVTIIGVLYHLLGILGFLS